jgi:hypothetical protein
MGFYLRKSISVGPSRFNLSKSGVGVSAGVKGLRFGVGPRGNYVHMGRAGLYYRATIPQQVSPSPESRPAVPNAAPPVPPGTHAPLQEIESADISRIVDSSSRELLNELNQKQQKVRHFPFVAVGSAIFLLIGLASWPKWLVALFVLIAIAACYAAHSRDVLAKTAVLFYDFEPEIEEAYGRLHGCASSLAACAGTWHIEAEGQVLDRKYHAGASSLVRRKSTFIRKAEPPYLKTNVETISIGVGRQTLHFFPDRVLVYDKDGVGAVNYRDLRLGVQPGRFIEDGPVLYDAKVVDRTWRYVNKSGGPDRRFKDNKELPICLYEQISLSSASGLNELIQVSRCGVAEDFAEAITMLGSKIPQELQQSKV